jgi:hypothetical protein
MSQMTSVTTPIFPTTPTPITLADGKVRHLRYSLGSVKRIKTQFGKTFMEILSNPPEEFLPVVIMMGLVEKEENLTEESLLEELLTGPMIEYGQLCFVEAFFGAQQRHAIDALLARNREKLAKALAEKDESEPEKKEATPTLQ